MTWNPSVPGAFGLEWPVTKALTAPLAADGVLIGARLDSAVTEDIDSERLWVGATGTPSGIVDVYDEALAELSGAGRVGYRTSVPYSLPIATVAAGSFTAVGAPSLWEAVDDGLSYSEADYITATGSTAVRFNINTLTTPSGGPMWAGRRILALGFVWYAASPGFPLSGGTLYPSLTIGGVAYSGTGSAVPANTTTGQLANIAQWWYNPSTVRPWTIADLEAFAAASTINLQWIGAWGPYIASPVRVYSLIPVVFWCDEVRAATSAPLAIGTVPAWNTFDLSTPDYYNMLTAQQASLESAVLGTSGWAAVSNCSIARTTAFFDTGAASLRMTATGAGTMTARTGSDLVEAPRVVPTRTYAARIRIRPVTVARTVSVAIEWSDESGTILSTSTGTASAETGGAFKEYTSVAAAPASAAHATVLVTVTAAGAGEAHDVDGSMLTPETVPAAFVAGGASRTFYEKRSAKSYVRTLRRWLSSGTITVPSSSADSAACPHVGWKTYRAPTVKSNSGNVQAGVPDDLGTASIDAMGVILTTTGAAVSADSQPYVGFPTSGGRVYSGNTIQQEFTPGSIATLSIPQIVLSAPLGTPTASITIKIKRRSDNVQFGGDATITSAQLTGTVTTRRLILTTLASTATLAAGTQYYFEYSSATTSAKPWQIGVLYTGGAGNTAGFGGTTDNFTDPALGAERQDMDAYSVLATPPATLTGFTVTLVTPTGTTIKALRAAWTGPSPSTGFASYELERDDGDGNGYHRVAVITAVGTVSFDDPHARLNVSTSYRVRWVRTDGAASSWVTASATRTSTGCKYEFVRSGVSATLWVHADDGESDGDREYEIDDGDPVIEALFDDNAKFASRRTERYGDVFTIQLSLYNSSNRPTTSGRRAFDTIYDLIDAATDYVVIHDSDGNRWYANVDLERPRIHQPGDFVSIDAIVTELDPGFIEAV